MAKAIAHITGTALRPGVSKNKRWYKPEHIAGMVASAQKRIGEGRKPMVMLSFHGAEDNSREITAALTAMTLEDDGRADFAADIIGTEAGRDIATLADSTDGRPALSTVSIRGFWTGRVRKERGPDGQMVETADGLEIEGVDWTKAPGVEGAEIKTFAWAAEGQTETTERVLITESVQEARVTITEEAAPEGPQGALREALALYIGTPLTEADSATPAISKRGSGTSGGGRKWADPGYQADGKQRYDITTKAKALTAWRYINQAAKASKYNAGQLKRIKGRIRAALAGFGVKAAASTETAAGWVFDAPCQVPETLTGALAEWYGDMDSSRSGSWSVSASNGPVNLSLSSYCMDPADLDVILRAAADAACAALKRLDPDMDGDVDVPAANSADTDHDGGHETAPEDDDPPATETAPSADGGEGPAPAGDTESEDSMPETATTTEAGAGAPAGLTAQSIAEATATAVAAAFEARDTAKAKAKKAAKDAAEKEAREAAARKSALTEALAELGIKVPAVGETAPAATATEAAPAGTLTEADVDARVKEALTEFTQALHSSGAILPQRAGMVVREHAIPEDADNAPTGEELRGKSDDDLMNYLGGAMAQQADAIRPVGAG